MSEDNGKHLLDLYYAALKSEDKDDIERVLSESTDQCKIAMYVFFILATKYTDIATAYCRVNTEIPSVYSSDESRNKLVANVANRLELGSNSTFCYKGDRPKGFIAKLAVERAIHIIEEIKELLDTHPDELSELPKELAEITTSMKSLEELNSSSADSWKSVLVDYVLLWRFATSEERAQCYVHSFPFDDLLRASSSYAESRLEARKAERLENLEQEFAEGPKLKAIWESDQSQVLPQEIAYLTRYQCKLDSIESMEPDLDCWKYALNRLVGEKLKRLLRKA
jgi:hypothetical protein